ncbi:MAG: hypothetical protein GY773_11235 [Actinomycetia bacterium]|nr:hypothetical protein [Actinomycetes bacterium]
MTKLAYSEAELFSEHDFAELQIVDGVRMHGGFMADGSYQPPRALGRSEALDAWTTVLRENGGEVLHADSSLLERPGLPNLEQHRLLLREGIGRSLWNSFTTTAKLEARGRILADMELPDLSSVVVEDISEMAIGHLDKGLIAAHGLDEGGLPAEGIGGHDVMWFVGRDLVFGPDAYDDVEPPQNIGRPEADERALAELPAAIEGLLSLLMNLLIIEFRAEIGFALTQEVLRTPDLFPGREAEVERAAEIIEHIRADELIHVTSIRLYLGELRSVHFRTTDGGTMPGAVLIDRLWGDLVDWATVQQPIVAARQQQAAAESIIAEHPDGARILTEFNRLAGANLATD